MVTCSGVDLDGFPNPQDRPPASDGLTILVDPGAFVTNQGGGATIELLQSNIVRVETTGVVSAEGGNAAILGTVPGSPMLSNLVEHHGELSSTGDGARGIFLPGEGRIESTGTVSVDGTNAVGLEAAEIERTAGEIFARGTGAVGIRGGTIYSIGDGMSPIFVIGDDAIGIDATTKLERNGTAIGIIGRNAIGLRTTGPNADTRAPMDIRGDGAIGILVLPGGGASNAGHVRVQGRGAVAAVVGEGGTFSNWASRYNNAFTGILDASASEDGIGLLLEGPNVRAWNLSGGKILGGTGNGAGVVFGDTPGTRELQLWNSSTRIESANGIAIRGGRGDDTVIVRSARIVGRVELGPGDDALINWSATSGYADILADGGPGRDIRRLDDPLGGHYDLGTAVGFERLEVRGDWKLRGTGSYSEGIFLIDRHTGVRAEEGAVLQGRVFVQAGAGVVFEDGVSLPDGLEIEDGGASFWDETGVYEDDTGISAAGGVRVRELGALVARGSNSIEGDLEIDSGSLHIPVRAGNSTSFDVDGDVTLRGSSQLRIVRTDSSPFSYSGPSTFRILTATGSLDGRFAKLGFYQSRRGGLDEIPKIGVIARYGSAGGIDFIDVTLTDSLGALGGTGNGSLVGLHLDAALAAGGSPGIQSLIDSLAPLTNAETADALDELHGAVYDAHTSTALRTGASYASLLAARPAPCELSDRADQQSPCDSRKPIPWVEGIGLFTDRDTRSGQEDWSSAGGGLAVGIDRAIGTGFTGSAMLGTSRSAVDFDGRGDGSYTSFEAGLGMAWRSGGARVRAVAGYGHGWHDTRRHIRYPGFSKLALGDYESNRVSGLVEADYRFPFGAFDLEPFASLDWTWLHEDKVDETNAGVARLDIDSRSNSLVATNGGLRAGATFAKSGSLLSGLDGIWRVEANGGWRQVWNDYDRTLYSRLAEAPAGTPDFRTRTQDAQYGAFGGARLLFQPTGHAIHFELGYEVFAGDRTTAHQVTGRLRVPL